MDLSTGLSTVLSTDLFMVQFMNPLINQSINLFINQLMNKRRTIKMKEEMMRPKPINQFMKLQFTIKAINH